MGKTSLNIDKTSNRIVIPLIGIVLNKKNELVYLTLITCSVIMKIGSQALNLFMPNIYNHCILIKSNALKLKCPSIMSYNSSPRRFLF